MLHGDEEVVYGDAGYKGIAKRPEMADSTAIFRVAMWPGKRRTLPDTPEVFAALSNLFLAVRHGGQPAAHAAAIAGYSFGEGRA